MIQLSKYACGGAADYSKLNRSFNNLRFFHIKWYHKILLLFVKYNVMSDTDLTGLTTFILVKYLKLP